ncbi:hypothetical protein ACQKEY_13375 [Lysinibacillus fusiformis]|uniref:hypothetical protein n=1 Tax=Lysinibacillus fusiformis TaxID=28031 RepID=UPI003D042741
MVIIERAIRVIEFLGYSSSLLHKAIKDGELVTVPYDKAFSDYSYSITRESFHDFLYKLKISERQINDIMDNI